MYHTQSPGAFLDTISSGHLFYSLQNSHPKVKVDKTQGHLEPHSLCAWPLLFLSLWSTPLLLKVSTDQWTKPTLLCYVWQIQSKQGSNG